MRSGFQLRLPPRMGAEDAPPGAYVGWGLVSLPSPTPYPMTFHVTHLMPDQTQELHDGPLMPIGMRALVYGHIPVSIPTTLLSTRIASEIDTTPSPYVPSVFLGATSQRFSIAAGTGE